MFDFTVDCRPKKFVDVWGNRLIKQCVKRWCIGNGFPKSILLVGDSGIGKTTLARLIGKRIVCEGSSREDIESCAKCSHCISPEYAFTELDLPNETVDSVRAFIMYRMRHLFNNEAVAYCDEIQRWNIKNQEILLKPMEELENSHFVLSTMDINAVEKAIVSRSTILSVVRPTPDEILAGLMLIAEKYKIRIGEAALRKLIRLSNNTPRRCLSVFNIIYGCDEEITGDFLDTDFIRMAMK